MFLVQARHLGTASVGRAGVPRADSICLTMPTDDARASSSLSARETMPSPDQYQAAAALRAGLRSFLQASEETLRGHGLTPERYELLLAVKSSQATGATSTIAELTTKLGVAQASVTQLVRRVEDAGLLTRQVSPTDARIRYLKLTRQGELRLAAAVADLAEERTRLAGILKRL
jgi:DNA-binding MarR family transcriptional regulator